MAKQAKKAAPKKAAPKKEQAPVIEQRVVGVAKSLTPSIQKALDALVSAIDADKKLSASRKVKAKNYLRLQVSKALSL